MSEYELQGIVLGIILILGLVYGVLRFQKKNRVGKGPGVRPVPPKNEDSIDVPPKN